MQIDENIAGAGQAKHMGFSPATRLQGGTPVHTAL